MSDSDAIPVPPSDPTAPVAPIDQQARQIDLLEKIVEQQAALLLATQAHNRPLTKDSSMRVRVIDFGMGFWSMVNFFLQAAIAAIPAAVILGLGWFFFVLVFGGILSAITR